MKAYMYFGILTKDTPEGRITEGRYGLVRAAFKLTDEEVKKHAITADQLFPLLSDGFALRAFKSQLIDPDIAPMNREDV